jgi:hypothetical protein
MSIDRSPDGHIYEMIKVSQLGSINKELINSQLPDYHGCQTPQQANEEEFATRLDEENSNKKPFFILVL